jgi:hypothetical protein
MIGHETTQDQAHTITADATLAAVNSTARSIPVRASLWTPTESMTEALRSFAPRAGEHVRLRNGCPGVVVRAIGRYPTLRAWTVELFGYGEVEVARAEEIGTEGRVWRQVAVPADLRRQAAE